MDKIREELEKAEVGLVRCNHSLAKYTTWKIGGPADFFVVCDTKEQLARALQILHKRSIPWTMLGRGSNLLVSDKGFRGAAIKLGSGFETLQVEGEQVRAGGAFSLIKLSVLVGRQGLTGLEFAGGIPGTVGGAVYMNAGAHQSDVSRVLTFAEIVKTDGETVCFSNEDMQFAYRHSRIHEEPGIVTSATFKLEQGDPEKIAAFMAKHKQRRLQTQPLQLASAGSVFRNPTGDFAARLIEASGLKGFSIGGAAVSDLHANFIVNQDQATARDILALIEKVKQEVFEKQGVYLQTEVLFLGER